MDLKSVSGSLVHTIMDPKRWQVALGHLCTFTHTEKALISLRDKQSARIVIPEDVEEEFASPLIFGFSANEVQSFLHKFAENDPWTEIERSNHPYFPYQLSRYLPREKLRLSDFWTWLEPQVIDDCIVCELGHTDTYWAALNLYFQTESKERTETILERVKETLPLLQSVWQSGRELQVAKTTSSSLEIVLASIEEPAALVEQDGSLLGQNEKMRAFLAKEAQPIDVGERLKLPMNMVLEQGGVLENIDLAQTAPTEYLGTIKAKAIRSTQFADGEPRQTFLLSIEPLRAQLLTPDLDVWDVQSLTERERTLVQLVANGMKFTDAQHEMSVSYPRVMQLWKSAREKLGVADVNELRLTHRIKSA